MKSILQLTIFLLFCSLLQAQQNYFAYIQTDNKQAFYVKMNDKILSSSGSGYIVIPKLITGNYTLTIGFAKDVWPQQSIIMVIGKQDVGYLLKNFGEKGWGLYNMQTMEIAMNGSSSVTKPVTTTNSEDIFTNTLAGATNTKLNAPKPIVPSPITIKEAEKKQEVEVKKENNSGNVQKIKNYMDIDGISITYTNNLNKNIDTINIFIPIEKLNSVVETPTLPSKQPLVTKDVRDQKFLDIDMRNSNANVAEVPAKISQKTTLEVPIVPANVQVASNKPVVNFNSDCKATANEDDFLKIRKKMAAGSTDDAMINAAQKFLKSTCFSVEQIKNLSLLFLNDAGKYKFFDAAYPHIYDTQNFSNLQNQLTDTYYLTRFKAMIRN